MAFEFNRNLQDALLSTTKALPATSSSNQSDSIDLGAVNPKNLESVEVSIVIPAIAAHVTAGNSVALKLQDSADNSSFADVDPLHQTSFIGVVTTGSLGKEVRFRLPPAIRRYIRFNQATGATDTLTGSSITYKILS